MVCYLCQYYTDECACCAYISSPTQPELETPAHVLENYNHRCRLPHATMVTERHFIDNNVFRRHVEVKTDDRVQCASSAMSAIARARKKRRLNTVAKTITNTPNNYPLAVVRLIRFQKLLAILGTSEWANVYFVENEIIVSTLIATHLYMIVGSDAKDLRKVLLSLILEAGNEDL